MNIEILLLRNLNMNYIFQKKRKNTAPKYAKKNAKFWSKEPQNRPIMERIVNGTETNSTNSWLSYAKLHSM